MAPKKPGKKSATQIENEVASEMPTSTASRKKLKVLSILLMVIAGVSVGLLSLPKNNTTTPEITLKSAWQAYKLHDIDAFEKLVDIDQLSESLVRAALEHEKAASTEHADVLGKIRSAVDSGMFSVLRHDLASHYANQMRSKVQTGKFPGAGKGGGVFLSLWHETAEKPETFVGVRIVEQTEDSARVVATFERPELNNLLLELPFDLVKTVDAKTGEHGWQVRRINGLSSFLNELRNLQAAQLAEMNRQRRSALDAAVDVLSLSKSEGVSEWGVGKGVMWRVAYKNTSQHDITELHAHLIVQNLEGNLLRKASIRDTDPLPAGQTAEKAWPMSINPLSNKDKVIYDSGLAELKTSIDVYKLVFANGDVLELLDGLPVQ